MNVKLLYRHSSIYPVNVGTCAKKRGSKNHINQGYLVVQKGRKLVEEFENRVNRNRRNRGMPVFIKSSKYKNLVKTQEDDTNKNTGSI